jgi:hypothetical protein
MHFIQKARPQKNYHLHITFDTGESFVLDMNPYLTKGVFRKLQKEIVFKNVFINPETKTITWNNDIDLCADSLYEKYKSFANAT